jgi:hypothetical protein
MRDCNVLVVQGNNVTQRAFFDFGYVRFVITTFLLGIMIYGTMAGIFFLVE